MPIRSVARVAPEVIRLDRRPTRSSATAREGHVIDVTAANLRRGRLRPSPELFDLSAPITLKFGARTLTHAPRPSIRTRLTRFRRWRDNRRLFPDLIDFDG